MISQRLFEIVNALPLQKGMRVLEIGCGPGTAAREVARRLETGHVLAIDRSLKSIQQAVISSQAEIKSGRLRFLQTSVEDLTLEKGEQLYDLAFAIRVGSLDGRHPQNEKAALKNIAKALTKKGRLFIATGNPIKEILLSGYR